MLIKFSVKNHLSFFDWADLSFLASRSQELPSHVVESKLGRVLRSAAIFGNNGAGKSNLYKSLKFAATLVKNAQKERIKVVPFKLIPNSHTIPTEFQFEILLDHAHYFYYFSILDGKINSEVCNLIEGDRQTLLYERTNETFKFGSVLNKVEGELFPKLITILKPTNLFLNELSNHKTSFDPLTLWFGTNLVILSDEYLEECFTGLVKQFNNAQRTNFTTLLKSADLGISDVKLKDNSELLEQMKKAFTKDSKLPDDLMKMILDKVGDKRVIYTHSSDDGFSNDFEIAEESDGTKKIAKLFALLIGSKSNQTFVVDELEGSLHPKLTQHFVKTFFEITENSRSQLIFTTHQQSLLNIAHLRRDEIWFARKNPNQRSELYSLTEFNERKDRDLEKAYLNGRFDAVPFLMSNPTASFVKE